MPQSGLADERQLTPQGTLDILILRCAAASKERTDMLNPTHLA